MIRNALVAAAAALACVSVAACSSGSATKSGKAVGDTKSGKAVSLSLASHYATTDPLNADLEKFAKAVGTSTSGKVKIKLYPNAELASEDEEISAVRAGSVNMAASSNNDWNTAIPGIATLEDPTVVETWQDVANIAENSEINSYLASEYNASGVHFLANVPYAFKYLLTTKPVTTIGDVKGLKIRISGDEDAPIIKALDAYPVTMSSSDLYEALLTHTVEGSIATSSSVVARKLYQPAKYYALESLGMSWTILTVNDDVWNKLSKDQQAAITHAATDLVSSSVQQGEAAEENNEKEIQSHGGHITHVTDGSAWDHALMPALEASASSSDVASKLNDLATAAKQG